MRRLAPVLLLLLAAASAAGEENAGPLSESKQQLKQLQKDQGARERPAAGADLKGFMPSIATPGPSGADLPPPPPASRSQTNDPPGQRSANWLLEGYDKLGAESAKGAKGARSLRGDNRDREGEGVGTDSLLSSTGRKQDERTGQTGTAARKSGPPPDPMEPFLKAWLANSPVKDAIFSARDSAKRLDNGFDLPGAETDPARESGASRPTTITSNLSGESAFGGKPENPYLQALNAPAPVTAPGLPPHPATVPSTPSIQGKISAPSIDATAASAAKSNAFSGPASQAKDDKKYFPQLKRF